MNMDKKLQKRVILGITTVAIIGGVGFVANNIYSTFQQKIKKSEMALSSIEQSLKNHALILENKKSSSLEQTNGSLVIKEQGTNQVVMTIDYIVEHPFSTWLSNEKHIPFKLKTTLPSIEKEIKLETGNFNFQGKGLLLENGNVELDLAAPSEVKIKNKPDVCSKEKESAKSISFAGQKLKINYLKNENKTNISYHVDSFKTFNETKPSENSEFKSVLIAFNINTQDPFDGSMNITAKEALFPSSKMQINDIQFKIATEKNKDSKYDFVIGGGIRKLSAMGQDNIGAQLQYSLRGISKKVLLELVEIEKLYSSELAKVKECEELPDSSTALIDAKTNAVLETIANEMLLTGFTSNIDTLRFANPQNYIDSAFQLKMEGVPSKALISFEDSLKLFFVLQLKGDVVKMVSPFLAQGQSMGFNIEPQTNTSVPQINVKVSYDKNGLVINEKPAPQEFSFIIKKILRDADRSAKFQNRPELVQETPAISENEGAMVEEPQPQPQPQQILPPSATKNN